MSRTSLCLCLLLFSLLCLETVAMRVFNQVVDVPKPDGSGVAFIQLQADPTDPNYVHLAGFNITGFNFIPQAVQVLRQWNPTAQNCNGTVLTTTSGSNFVHANGMVCFYSNTSAVPEFQNSFTFSAFGDGSPVTGTVTLLNYNRQLCPGIPDLGASGSFKIPPTPTALITLAGLEIKFSVNVTYIRNESAWYLDFWNFDPSAGADSADGSNRTCSNHDPDTYTGKSFYEWWFSAPRASYDSTVDASISDALDSSLYPNYNSSGTVWTITELSCSKINYEATIPVSRLIGNATTDCHRKNDNSAAASSLGSLRYAGILYVNSLRPSNLTVPSAGYFMSTFEFPFQFQLQTTVSDLDSASSRWDFEVTILGSLVTYTGSPEYTLDIQTTMYAPGQNSPNVLQTGFSLTTYPYSGERAANLTRVSDNGNCGGSTHLPCSIHWRMVLPALGNLTGSAYDTQYVGKYTFTWNTTGGDIETADIYADVSASNPATNLTQVPVTSSMSFFTSQADLTNLTATALSPVKYGTGERIFVRHSFLVDPLDTKAFIFTLWQAFVCYSNVPGFTPSLSGGMTGCMYDIPGVMEAADGERYVLYDSHNLPSGIADFVGSNPGEQSRIWDWVLTSPLSGSWTNGSTVNNGFAINAQPLAIDSSIHNYYFHLVSNVTQAPLGRSDFETQVVHHLVSLTSRDVYVLSSSGSLAEVQIGTAAATLGGDGSSSSAASALTPLVSQLKDLIGL